MSTVDLTAPLMAAIREASESLASQSFPVRSVPLDGSIAARTEPDIFEIKVLVHRYAFGGRAGAALVEAIAREPGPFRQMNVGASVDVTIPRLFLPSFLADYFVRKAAFEYDEHSAALHIEELWRRLAKGGTDVTFMVPLANATIEVDEIPVTGQLSIRKLTPADRIYPKEILLRPLFQGN
jgi:hypothetical protein